MPAAIKRGSWCPACFDESGMRGASQRLNIDVFYEIAKRHGGECLSKRYLNSKSKLNFKCALGHLWSAIPANIKAGRWCKRCACIRTNTNRKSTIKEMMLLAQNREGRCLSKEYLNDGSHLLWECSKKHTWLAKANNIKQGKWCPRCAGRKETGSLKASN